MDPARIFTESLTPRPELENSLGQSRLGRARSSHVRNAPLATVDPKKAAWSLRANRVTLQCGRPTMKDVADLPIEA
jgi:hypothetical protein